MFHSKWGRFWLAIITILCLTGLGGAAWWNHRATTQPVVKKTPQAVQVLKRHVTLVAIGDSLTHGQGDNRNQQGYVGRIKKRLEKHYHNQVTTYNYGVTGDRSDQMLKRLQKQPKMRANLKKADVITMTVGGNDLMQKLESNLLNSSTNQVTDNLDKAGQVYQAKLEKLLTAIRQQNADAPIFMYSIYDPFYVYYPNSKIINDAVARWNQITEQTVTKYGPAYFVDINHLMSYGQYKTSRQREKLALQSKQDNSEQITQKQVISIMNTGQSHNLNKYISTEDNFHPNAVGYDQMTKALYRKMVKYDSWVYQQKDD